MPEENLGALRQAASTGNRGTTRRCRMCNGEGEIDNSDSSNLPFEDRVRCPRCDGTGRVERRGGGTVEIETMNLHPAIDINNLPSNSVVHGCPIPEGISQPAYTPNAYNRYPQASASYVISQEEQDLVHSNWLRGQRSIARITGTDYRPSQIPREGLTHWVRGLEYRYTLQLGWVRCESPVMAESMASVTLGQAINPLEQERCWNVWYADDSEYRERGLPFAGDSVHVNGRRFFYNPSGERWESVQPVATDSRPRPSQRSRQADVAMAENIVVSGELADEISRDANHYLHGLRPAGLMWAYHGNQYLWTGGHWRGNVSDMQREVWAEYFRRFQEPQNVIAYIINGFQFEFNGTNYRFGNGYWTDCPPF